MGQKKHYRADVDGLRALAVAMVIANHLDHRLAPGGYFGVDLFFVISGFVVTGSIVGRDDRRPWRTQLADFYARRIRRLFPSLMVCVAVTLIASSLFLPYPSTLAPVGFAALFGGGNIYLYTDSKDYFSQAAHENPFTHTWSLGAEEQFYLLFPLMLLIGAAWLGKRRWMLIAGLSLLSFVAYLWVVPVDRMAAFYLMPLRFWELGAGALLYFWDRHRPAPRWSRAAALVGLGGIVAATAHPSGPGSWPIIWTVAGSALVVWGHGGWGFDRVFGHPIAVEIGKRSYALYLWHWPVAVIVARTVEITPVTGLVALAATFGITELSYRFVEVPLRQAHWGTSGRTLLKGLGASVATAAVGLAVVRYPFFLGYRPPDIWWLHGEEPCWAGRYTPEKYDRCLAPANGDPSPRVFLVGDSHARALLPALQRALPETPVYSLAIAFGCSIVADGVVTPSIEEETACEAFNRGVFRLLEANARPDDVIVVGTYFRYVKTEEDEKAQAAHLRALADAVAPTTVIFMGDAPGLPDGRSGIACQSQPWNRYRNERCRMTADAARERMGHHERAIREAARAPNAHVFTLDQLLCEQNSCSAYLDGVLLYVDGDHLSIEGSQLLSLPFRDFLVRRGFFSATHDRESAQTIRWDAEPSEPEPRSPGAS